MISYSNKNAVYVREVCDGSIVEQSVLNPEVVVLILANLLLRDPHLSVAILMQHLWQYITKATLFSFQYSKDNDVDQPNQIAFCIRRMEEPQPLTRKQEMKVACRDFLILK